MAENGSTIPNQKPIVSASTLSNGSQVTIYYEMQGYRPNTSDFETWVVTGTPSTSNPSGQPIQNVRIISSWVI
jgi:hypothetical protein